LDGVSQVQLNTTSIRAVGITSHQSGPARSHPALSGASNALGMTLGDLHTAYKAGQSLSAVALSKGIRPGHSGRGHGERDPAREFKLLGRAGRPGGFGNRESNSSVGRARLAAPQDETGRASEDARPVSSRDQLPKTWYSQREYPYANALTVPYMRTYRPLPDTVSVCTPPVPVVVV
jgi:hypothetical protein